MSSDSDPYIFTTDTLPGDVRFLPPLANGLLGWKVFSNIMHMGGVYNGEAGDCHRADVPCPLAVKIETEEPAQHSYALNTHTGILFKSKQLSSLCFFTVFLSFSGIFSHTVSSASVTATQSLYSHRFYANILVMEVLLERQVTSEEPVIVNLVSAFTPQSKDIQFESSPDYKGGR